VSGELNNTKKTALIIISAAAMVLAAAALGLYFWYPTTPVYTLSQASKAIRAHDWDAFSRYVQVEKLSMEFAKDVTYISYQALTEKGIPSIAGKKLAVALGTRVKNSLDKDIRTWIVNGVPPKFSVLGLLMKGSQGTDMKLKGITWKDGKARAKIGSDNTNIMELEMEKQGGTWRIVKIGNVRELYERAKGKL